MSTCSFLLPPILASNTLGIVSMSSCKISAKSWRVLLGTSPLKEMDKIGNVLMLTSLTVGSSASLGRSPLALSTLSLISTIAWSESNPASNSNKTLPPPE